jgi:Protein of unknown function (DUF3987)
MREIAPAAKFPFFALGDVLAPMAEAIDSIIQAPDAICGTSTLAAAAVAVQGHADVKISGQLRFPSSEYFLPIAGTGDRKTAADNAANRAHRQYQQEQWAKYQEKSQQYRDDVELHKRERDHALRHGKDRSERKAKLQDLSTPQKPLQPLFLCDDPTFEGLVRMLTVAQPSVGIFSDEAGILLGGFALRDENLHRTAAGLSALWNGTDVTRVRAKEDPEYLFGRRVSLNLMAQPDIGSKFIGSRALLNQGLLSRVLTAWPDSKMGSRKFVDEDLYETDAARTYYQTMRNILAHELPMHEQHAQSLAPRGLPLDKPAMQLWLAYQNTVESALGPGGTFEPIKGFGSKLPEHAARLAAVLTLVEDLDAPEIGREHMGNGITLAEFFTGEALRLVCTSSITQELELAHFLLDWLLKKGLQQIYVKKVVTDGPSRFRTSQRAREVIAILETHGYLLPQGEQEIDGARRRESWAVNTSAALGDL